ncbi:uncharacterized protein LOC131245903 isoform X4 [Magnolia sinica]|uniref:uncharacterized protein LOC131245903 isoform X4 n=1 Tax=Magnolia sinica TaxID=86752 RepID=UPI00265AF6FA|nr:uncharacterized protein LOC131245903 isoform X4 [Magnolia sinica]
MESEVQPAPSNPSAMLASLVSKRKKLQEELRSIEKQAFYQHIKTFLFYLWKSLISIIMSKVYELETSYLHDSSQCGNVLKGFEGFLSSSKSTTKWKSMQLDVMMEGQILVQVGRRVEAHLLMDRESQRRVEQCQEMGRESGHQVNRSLMMKTILI